MKKKRTVSDDTIETTEMSSSMASRRRILGASAAVGMGTVLMGGAGGLSPANAVSTEYMAPPPSGNDDTALLKDAMSTGKYLRAGTYRCDKTIDVSHAAIVGIPGFTAIKVNG